MRRLLKNRIGSATLLYFGLVFVLLLMTFLIIEMGTTLENYGYAESVLQRACNTAVEKNIDNAYRADHILLMDPEGAAADFRVLAAADLPPKYRFKITSIQCTASPPSMTVIGSITFETTFSKYGFNEITHSLKVVSTNYDLD